ncbi:MAG: benzoyl-CoA reductase subunit C [Deltaproteobacteria bacterium]|nr:benzoyl-CoA reductase subunit C [Deltaproteobacteria bacterium]
MDCEEIISRHETLCQDTDFNYVRQWKAKRQAKVVGFMPVYIPKELVVAAGMLPVGIMGAGDREIIRGDAYFQSYICRIPRSTLELGVKGKLDFLDVFLFPAICDVIRNLSGMWKILFPKVFVKYLDLPQNFGPVGRKFYIGELEGLAADFERLSGKKLTDQSLRSAIELYNENRRVLRDLYNLRAKFPHLVSTYDVYLLLRASNLLEVSEHTQCVSAYIRSAVKRQKPERDHVRVVISGAFCEQPPLALIKALEGSGCYIVDDDWVLGCRYLLSDISLTKQQNPMEALADAYLTDTVSNACRFETSRKGEFLIGQVKDRSAEGVIFAAPSFCDPALLERPMLQDALSAQGVAYTGFKYAENTGQIQVIKEETGTFADSIKLWGSR